MLVLLIFAVTIDGFAAAITMGGAGIHIPKKSAAVLSLTGTAFLGVSAFFSTSIGALFPIGVLKIISAALLAALGIADIVKKSLRKRYEKDCPSAIFLDETKSDKNHDKVISLREAMSLSVVLSADSLATGAASARIMSENLNLPITLAATLVVGFFAVLIGNRLGKNLLRVCKFDFEKLCGVVLILLAAVSFF
jgi:putative sporulation protein YtaF